MNGHNEAKPDVLLIQVNEFSIYKKIA